MPLSLKHRILDAVSADRWSLSMHRCGEPVVLVTGVFDIITPGHIKLIEFAAEFGSVCVGLNCDDAVRKLKGIGRPVNNQQDRMTVMAGLRWVGVVFPISDTTVTLTIHRIKPNIWVKGGDYTLETLLDEEVQAAKEENVEIKFAPHSGHSSSKIIQHAQSLKH